MKHLTSKKNIPCLRTIDWIDCSSIPPSPDQSFFCRSILSLHFSLMSLHSVSHYQPLIDAKKRRSSPWILNHLQFIWHNSFSLRLSLRCINTCCVSYTCHLMCCTCSENQLDDMNSQSLVWESVFKKSIRQQKTFKPRFWSRSQATSNLLLDFHQVGNWSCSLVANCLIHPVSCDLLVTRCNKWSQACWHFWICYVSLISLCDAPSKTMRKYWCIQVSGGALVCMCPGIRSVDWAKKTLVASANLYHDRSRSHSSVGKKHDMKQLKIDKRDKWSRNFQQMITFLFSSHSTTSDEKHHRVSLLLACSCLLQDLYRPLHLLLHLLLQARLLNRNNRLNLLLQARLLNRNNRLNLLLHLLNRRRNRLNDTLWSFCLG